MPESKADKLIREIDRNHAKYLAPLYDALHDYQESCRHRRVKKVAKSNTGNWCRSDDSYWYDCYCPTCRKRWTEPQ